MNKIISEVKDIDGGLSSRAIDELNEIEGLYSEYLAICRKLENGTDQRLLEELTDKSKAIGRRLEEITKDRPTIHVYSFETPREQHAEASRIISKLRDPKTGHEEFIYYTQRAFELLFSHSFADRCLNKKVSIIKKTPVTIPIQNYAVHRIPDIDEMAHSTVMCVMLRGALLPSMIVSKEIEDYSSDGYVTPFALFKVKRDESKNENNMEYVLDLDKSYFSLEDLNGRDLIFADPMNATGGSLLSILNYLKKQGIKPRSIKVLNVILSLKGALRISENVKEAEIYTLWMDPVLNQRAYIMPGLGDAGDRLNGVDIPGDERNMMTLIADYGSNIINLYRDQVREIERTVLG